MSVVPNVLVVVGFCLGTLGAAGFNQPREPYALALLGFGMILLVAGGLWGRHAKRSRAAAAEGSSLAGFQASVEAIRDKVVELDRGRGTLAPREIHRRIDALLRDEYFDLTSRSDELIGLVGFNAYAKAWDGIATAERLLARCWSMITDDFPDEGLAELPLARESLDHAAGEFARLARR
jgi:hypothetical protein